MDYPNNIEVVIMESINERYSGKAYPIRVLQFGEGNFLRAFADWMIDILNEKMNLNAGIVLVKPIPMGSLERFNKQNNLYTVSLRGNVEGRAVVENRVVTSVTETVDCYAEYEKYAAYAKCGTLRFVISNTTEAGIVYDGEDKFSFNPPHSYPGKLTKLLYERAEHFGYSADKGLIILPVELIDDNGIQLKKCVVRLAKDWGLGEKFLAWLDDACVFTSTLVDRIVTGYPRENAEEIWRELGYKDELLVTAEPFGLWVIESPKDISKELPFPEAGLPVIYTDNQKPYKQRKVRILNGAHTSFVLAAYLAGHNIVRDAMQDAQFLSFMRDTLYKEVIPTLNLPKDDLVRFAEAVEYRFNNPFVDHQLLSIALNSVSKWKARCQPSFEAYYEKTGKLPKHLAFSLAALIAFYNGERIENGALIGARNGEEYRILDDAKTLEFFMAHPMDAQAVLSNTDFWGCDLTKYEGLCDYVSAALADIRENGMKAAIAARFPAEG